MRAKFEINLKSNRQLIIAIKNHYQSLIPFSQANESRYLTNTKLAINRREFTRRERETRAKFEIDSTDVEK